MYPRRDQLEQVYPQPIFYVFSTNTVLLFFPVMWLEGGALADSTVRAVSRMHNVCRLQPRFNNTKTTHYSRTNDFNARKTGVKTNTRYMSRGGKVKSMSQTPIVQAFLREFWTVHLHPARALQKEGAQISTADVKTNQTIHWLDTHVHL